MVYTTGYHRHTPAELLQLAVENSITACCDIRYWQRGSKERPEWGQENLLRVLGDLYVPMRCLGNIADREDARFIIADYPLGLSMVERLMGEHGGILLFCACRNPAKCHRSRVADLLSLDGIVTEELEWPSDFSPWDDPERFYTERIQPIVDKYNEWKARRQEALAQGKTLSPEAQLKWDRLLREYQYVWGRWDAFRRTLKDASVSEEEPVNAKKPSRGRTIRGAEHCTQTGNLFDNPDADFGAREEWDAADADGVLSEWTDTE